MAQDQYKSKLAISHGIEEKAPESKSLKLKRLILACAAVGLIAVVGVGIGMAADEIRCNDVNIMVRFIDLGDALIACEGARDAIEFLASQGLDVTGDIAIEIVMQLPAFVGVSAAGCYLASEHRALILVYSEFRKFKTWFGIPIDHSLYRSLVSHEVAHMVVDYNFKIPKPSIPAKEYIAYVTQFSTMRPALLRRVLSNFPRGAFENDWQMSTIIYAFDCMSFGAGAYKHFQKQASGRGYLHAILTGKALIEDLTH